MHLYSLQSRCECLQVVKINVLQLHHQVPLVETLIPRHHSGSRSRAEAINHVIVDESDCPHECIAYRRADEPEIPPLEVAAECI